ncbi:MAG TPA: menaquinone biosynthesis protein [Fimbriimonadaceae bacterium]|nr:menaquinone biosynthesis protein [Fimbriimonadaceae bacterium]
MITIGSVPYVNARPLVQRFDDDPALGIKVEYDVPSKLAQRLSAENWDVALVSSYFALASDLHVADGVGIISDGPVASVRVFSKVPFERVERLALDQSSMTSNALAQIILHEQFGVVPLTRTEPPNLESMLSSNDACVLIGDIGLETAADGLHVIDLGAAWNELTGLPFVWALWTGTPSPALVRSLNSAYEWSLSNWDRVVESAQTQSGWSLERVQSYLTSNVQFHFGEREKTGLSLFCDLLQDDNLTFPHVVTTSSEVVV